MMMNLPITNNIIATIGTLLYVKAVLFICTSLVKYSWVDSKLSRKLIHVLAGVWLLAWPFFDPNHWSWVLAMTVPFVYFWILLYKGLFVKDRNDSDVRSMSRSGDPKELLAGPLYYLTVMCVIGFSLFMTRIGVLTMSVLSWGDGLAPYFGERYGKASYKTLGRQKTYVGSLVMLSAAFIGGILVYIPMFGPPDLYLLFAYLIACVLGTVAEALSPADLDNFIVPIVAFFTLKMFGIYQ